MSNLPAPTATRKPNHNQWTRAKMVLFLRELAASQSVSQAARSVGLSRQSAYRLRNRMEGTPFSLAWDVALEAGLQQLAHAMMERAVNGVEVPHFHNGEQVGSSRRYDERLSIWLMSNPWKVGRRQVAREYVAEGWDKLLERIESASLDWEQGESLPGSAPHPPARRAEGAKREDKFLDRSWYADDAQYTERLAGRQRPGGGRYGRYGG